MDTRDPRELPDARFARNVEWPALVAACERRGVPVSRVDDQGHVALIRTRAQLAAEWE